MTKKRKKKNRIKIVLLSIISLFLILVLGVTAGIAPFVIKYYKNSYEKHDIVDRTEDYVMPEQDPQPDEYENAVLTEDDLGKDLPEAKEPLPIDPNAKGVYGITPIYKVPKKNPDIENILILGTDSRDVNVSRGRSDSIIVMSYNKATGQVKMVSILRDSLVPIEGHGWNRINAAYSFDGVGLTVNTVNQLFDLDIQRFAVINFESVKTFINKIGGVDIVLTEKEADFYNKKNLMGKEVEAGLCHMNGNMALTYMRTRKLDSDFKRTERQRKVIQVVATKLLKEKTLPEIYYLTDFAMDLVKTNIPITELTTAITTIVEKNGTDLKMESQHIPYSDAFKYKYYNGMAITSFDIDDAAKRLHKFIYG